MELSELIHRVFFEVSYVELFLLTLVYFLLLYFVVGALFSFILRLFLRLRWTTKIIGAPLPAGQIRFEIRNSFLSIFIFGFSSLPIAALVRSEWITLLPDSLVNTLIGLVVLTCWNELHFFVVHRLMHTRFFLRNVHHIHHRSLIPTVYSVYSFHWVEALLLSTVPLTIVLFFPLSALALACYPLTSILINFAGHCNVRFGNGTGNAVKLFGTLHNEHHSKGRRNYGFATPFLDWLNSRLFKPTILSDKQKDHA